MRSRPPVGKTAGSLAANLCLLVLLTGCARTPDDRGNGVPSTDSKPPEGVSKLWGVQGESWNQAGRLPDFSFAGYRAGEYPIPEVPVRINVRDYGARGDGLADDTAAFQQALQAVSDGAIFVPSGRYRITEPLEIGKSHVVLRGQDRDSTVLFFPKSLYELFGTGPDGGPYGWSWGGAWIRVNGDPATGDSSRVTWTEGDLLAGITSRAERGARLVEVSATDKIHPGQWIRITQHETDGSLGLELHGGHPLDGRCKLDSPGQRMLQWVVRVEDVIEGRIDIGRPLRVAVDPAWGAQIWASEPPVREVGIEHLTLEFPEREYGGHHHEQGLNGISLAAAFDSWVRDVAILNADNGVMLWYSKYCTVTELTLAGRGGHYGVNLAGAQDSLVTRFRIDTVFVHDLSVANLANGNVVSNGVGRRINFDHHRYAPYENLFSNIDVGTSARAARIWYSSDTLSGHYTAARETFWNLRPRVGLKYLPRWPEMNLIGPVKAKAVIDSHETGIWIEAVPDLRPLNLHASQRAKRLGRADSPPGLLPKSVPGYDGDSRPSRSPEWLYKSGLERE